MTEQYIPDSHNEDVAALRSTQAPAVRLEALISFPAPIGLLDRGVDLDSPRWRESSPGQALLDTLGRYKPRQNPTGASLPQIRRDLARAWRLMLALQIDEALRMIERLEMQLDDVPPANARRLRGATQLLRAAGLALQDDSLAVLPIAVSLLKKGGTTQDDHAALTLCRLRFWRLGEFDSFYLLPRLEPRVRWSKSLAVSAMLDLSIEAAVALDHLRLSTARRLALDALNIAKSTPKEAAGLATVPACVAAQVLYEEGCLDQADTLLRDRLPVINARGPIESALRAYVGPYANRQAKEAMRLRSPVAPRGARRWGNAGVGHGSLPHASPSAPRCYCREARRGKLVSSWNTSIAMRSRTVRDRGTPPPRSLDIALLRVGACLGPRLPRRKRSRDCDSSIIRRLKSGTCILVADWRSSLPKCSGPWRNSKKRTRCSSTPSRRPL